MKKNSAAHSRFLGSRALAAVLILMIAAGLGGCGKRSSLEPPPDSKDVYPRTYPHG